MCVNEIEDPKEAVNKLPAPVIIPRGMQVTGHYDASRDMTGVLWKWKNDWDYRFAATLEEAIAEAEKTLWRPKVGEEIDPLVKAASDLRDKIGVLGMGLRRWSKGEIPTQEKRAIEEALSLLDAEKIILESFGGELEIVREKLYEAGFRD